MSDRQTYRTSKPNQTISTCNSYNSGAFDSNPIEKHTKGASIGINDVCANKIFTWEHYVKIELFTALNCQNVLEFIFTKIV